MAPGGQSMLGLMSVTLSELGKWKLSFSTLPISFLDFEVLKLREPSVFPMCAACREQDWFRINVCSMNGVSYPDELQPKGHGLKSNKMTSF